MLLGLQVIAVPTFLYFVNLLTIVKGVSTPPGLLINTSAKNNDKPERLMGMMYLDKVSLKNGHASPHDVRSIAGGSKGLPIYSSNILCQQSPFRTIIFNRFMRLERCILIVSAFDRIVTTPGPCFGCGRYNL